MSDTAYPSLTRALTEALVDVVWFVEGYEGEEGEEDDAVKALEGVAHVVGGLTAEQRDEFLDVLEDMAREESDPERKEFLEDFPEDYGVVDEED
ncbi:hypothetical protein ABT160_06230 [Streptomyces sp. NPDC001941]|uniref:hypothetical protein n=1 Tax=Streptomyces sp. NPDC001941 TaxID=3154659 RepID=UPI00332B2E3D